MKILYFDTETTGLTDRASIIQISGIIEIDGKVRETFNLFAKPRTGSEISQIALDIQGRSLSEIELYEDPEMIYNKLIEIFSKYISKFDKNDKFIVAGYNVDFDIRMLQNFFNSQNDKFLFSWISHKKLDPLNWVLPLQLLGKLPELQNNKLDTWCEHFGIVLKAHDSLEDIVATRKLTKIFMELMR